MRTARWVLVVGLLLSLGAGNQKEDRPGPATQPATPPTTQPIVRRTMLADDEGKPVAGVHIAKADLRVTIDGTLCQTTMTITVANTQPRILGGTVVFPLPEGATVTGYGLEIDGKIVDGVAVEKERARLIYEQELHKRVDPGLVEHVEGNLFRTRLYPIPANGTRALKIEYVTPLGAWSNDASVALPLAFADSLDELSVSIAASGLSAAPSVKAGIDGATFEKTEHGYAAQCSQKNVKTADELVIALPKLAAQSVSVGKRLKYPRTIEEIENAGSARAAAPDPDAFEYYFTASDTPEIAVRHPIALPNHRVAVIWDASLDRADADVARELKVLAAALRKLGDPAADLVILRNDLEFRPANAAGPQATQALIESIRALPFDGARNLDALVLPKNASAFAGGAARQASADYDLLLMFTNAVENLGSGRFPHADAPLFAFSNDARANHAVLRWVCQQSGGAYCNLMRMTDDAAIDGVGAMPLSLVSIDADPAQIAEVYPTPGTPITGRLTISGKLLAPRAKLTLHYGFGKEVTASQSFDLTTDGAVEGPLLPRFWAQQKVAAMSLEPGDHADELSALGRRFNLVTPNTSLLVLETADQYVQYRVVPPTSRPEIYKQFLAQIEQHKAQVAKSREEKLQQVAALWAGRVQWWEKEYKYPKNFIAPPEQGNDVAVAVAPRAADVPAPSPANEPAVAANTPLPREERRAPGQHTPAAVAGLSADGRGGRDQQLAQQPAAQLGDATTEWARLGRRQARSGAEEELRQRQFGLFDHANGVDGKMSKVDDAEYQESLVVQIKPWDPNTPYIAAMKAVTPDKAYGVYLEQRRTYRQSPAFYFDCADYLLSVGQRKLAIRVLGDVTALQLQDARLLRVAAHRFNEMGERTLAIDLFEKVLHLRPEEPQSYRDLALALADRADAMAAGATNPANRQQSVDAAISDYMRSLELLNKVVLGDWPRFAEIELPVLMEANDIAAKAQRLPGVHDFHNPIDARLQKNLDCDVRIVMTWDADQTDIDLWVTEPSREKCFYGHNRTVIGGMLSRDFTDGYGPEEYCLRRMMSGKYLIQANFFGSRQQELTGPCTVQATVITDFGRPTEKRQLLSFRLKDAKEVVDIGQIALGNPAPVPQSAPPSSNKKRF